LFLNFSKVAKIIGQVPKDTIKNISFTWY
jgi:hypothetical protein